MTSTPASCRAKPLSSQDPAKESDEEDLQDNEECEWAVDEEHSEYHPDEQRPECDSPNGKNSSASRSGSITSGGRRSSSRGSFCSSSGTGDSKEGDRTKPSTGKRSPPKRRMSMSIVLPEGPVRRHRYQPPPTVHSYLNKMNAEVGGLLKGCGTFWSGLGCRI